MKALAESTTSGRERAALALAMLADVVQIGLWQLFIPGAWSPLNDALDVVVAVMMFWLLGFHWMLLPSTVAEFVPALNIVPTWTAAVVFVLRARKKLTKAELRAWSPMEPREVGRSAVGSKDDGPDERQS